MIAGDILGQIAKGESASIAFAPDGGRFDEIASTVCGLLNTRGGVVFVGVAPNRMILGVGEDPDEARRTLESALQDRITPKALFTVSIDAVDGASILSIEVPEGRDVPYVVEGRVFVRRGRRTELVRPDELRNMVHARSVEADRWERRPSLSLEFSDLDEDQIRTTVSEASERGQFDFIDRDPRAALQALNLSRSAGFTNACDVLFGRKPAARHPQCRVRFIQFESDKTGSAYLDDQWFDGPLMVVYERLIEKLAAHARIQAYFAPGEHMRQDRFNYAIEALREGLVNALAHRDYAGFSGGLSVSVFPNRIEIWNSGRLPREIKVPDLKRPHPSIPTNPDIAHVLYLRRLMERVGRGTQKIIAACDELGARPPKWVSEASGVTLTIYAASASSGAALSPRQAQILERLRPGDTLKLWDYVRDQDVSERQARRDLSELEALGFVTRSGRARATLYQRTSRTV